jgi:hypothetical protein
MSQPVAPVEISFEGAALPGYLYRPLRGGPQATLIMHNGFDGWADARLARRHPGRIRDPARIQPAITTPATGLSERSDHVERGIKPWPANTAWFSRHSYSAGLPETDGLPDGQ